MWTIGTKAFEIHHGVPLPGTIPFDASKGVPERVLTLLRPSEPLTRSTPLRHAENVFYEDRLHDWCIKGTSIDYYSRISLHGASSAIGASVLVIFDCDDTDPAREP
jgi:hypothetical protein